MKVLVYGATSQIGRALAGRPGVTLLTRGEADLSDPRRAARMIDAHRPDAVINAACHADIDGCETARGRAFLVNGRAPGVLAQRCAARRVPFVHVSSEFVFSGAGGAPWSPESRPAPCQAFGRSRLRGELQVRAAGGAHAILRTSWLFSGEGRNVLRSILRAGAARGRVSVRHDLVAQPTPAAAAAEAALTMARALAGDGGRRGTNSGTNSGTCSEIYSGTYHMAGDMPVTLASFAREAFAAAALDVEVVPLHGPLDVPGLADRPRDGRLACHATTEAFGIVMPDWRAALPAAVAAARMGAPRAVRVA
ncbi:MAG: sugar nucleotide-binding protein [Pseudomonadota bacterium]